VFDILNKQLTALAQQKSTSLQMLTSHLHVLPYWHGNRSPRADPTLQGMISGLTLGDTLAIVYFATLQAIALGTRHIISEMNKQGYNIDTIFMTGGFAKNILFVEELASITKCRVVLAQESDAVLLGSAILGAVASKEYDSILSAMSAMNKVGKIFEPSTDPRTISFYDAKYQVFLKMYEHQMEYRALMNQHSTEVDK
jgi:ribulose kinase